MKSTEELKKYKTLSLEQLEAEEDDARFKLAGYSLKVQAGKMDNFSLIGKTKKNIARLRSIISEKKLEI